MLVESGAGEATPDILADRLTTALREPVVLGEPGRSFSTTVSIGVAVGPYDAADDLLRDADLALYAAKAAGKDRYALFEPSMHAGVRGPLQLESDLTRAIEREELTLLYQPIYELRSGRAAAVEALIRWNHPELGVLTPDHFIPLAEESGLIVPIGRWVLEEACRQTAAWRQAGMMVDVSVNVSVRQLGRGTLAADVGGALRRSGLAPTSLTLEVTETALMRDVSAAREDLESVRAVGVRVAIDDFGTGYASLAHLQNMPVDTLKIDRTFVGALDGGGHGRELLEAIVGVGEALGAVVIAEGVEHHSQLTALEEMGCSMAQGFLLARPGPAEAIGESLADIRFPRA